MRFLKTCALILILSQVKAQDVEQIIKAKPFSWTGAIGTTMTTYLMKGDQNRMNPFHYGFYGNVNIRIYETFELPFAFNYSQYGLDIDKPFYQMGISPKYKWVQVHLGHRNMFFNSYTLAGHTFWGAGVELTPGKFRLSAMRGNLRDPLLIDARTGQELLNPQFKRDGWGVKLGVGSFSNYVDLMLFKAQDIPESIDNWQDSIYQNSISGLTGRFAPAENLILGLTSRFTLFSKITLNIEAGGSLYTTDISSEKLIEERKLFTPRTSSIFKWAGKSSLNFPIGPIFFSAAYERILPDYFSMGAYNFVNDMENITISPAGSFWNGRLSLSGMFGTQRNNLLGNRSETTRRLITNANATIAPNPNYGLNLAYTNFSFNQQAQAIILDDSLLIKQVNQSITIMPYYNIIPDTSTQHSIQAAYIFQNAEDLNPITRDFGTLTTNMITTTYSYRLNNQLEISGGLSHTSLQTPLLNNKLMGLNLGVSKQLAKPAMNLNLNTQINSTRVNGIRDGSLISTALNANYQLEEKHNFRASFNWLRSASKAFTSYNEIIFNLGYTYQIR